MFTGLIEATARVLEAPKGGLRIERPASFTDIHLGSSICVSGICLTIVALDEESMTFDLMEETLKRTTFGDLRAGDHVNLERALRADGRFEGHIVQGHVDGVGEVVHVGRKPRNPKSAADEAFLTVKYPRALQGLIVEKGSIAVDGVSLTVASLEGDQFSVALIPHTLQTTTLSDLQEGDRVNLEADILGKYVRAVLDVIE